MGDSSSNLLTAFDATMAKTPSPTVHRHQDSPSVGLVGRFLNIAPHLLHDGRCTQKPPPPPAHDDWWVHCIDTELAQPAAAAATNSNAVPPATPGAEDFTDEDQAPQPDLDWWGELVGAEFTARPSSTMRPLGPASNTPCATPVGEPSMNNDPVVSVLPTGAFDSTSLDLGPSAPSSDDEGVRSVQEEIEAEVCIPLRTLVLRTKPRLRHSRTPVAIDSLRRSGRIAAKPRASNTTRQAQNVLLKKLGIAVEENAADAEIEAKFRGAFRGDLSANKKHVLQLLLNGDTDVSAMDLDLAELEGLP